MMKIEGAGYPLGKIFNDDFLFTIPNYQRPYAWTTDFDRKKEIYCNNKMANFALTIQARNEKEWTKDVMERRQKALIQKLREIWRL